MGIGLDAISPETDVSCKGIVPRAITDIFDAVDRKAQENHSYESSLTVSFLELYNEELIDLLNPRPRSASGTNAPVIREDSGGNIVWQNLSEESVSSVDEIMRFLHLT